MGQWSEFTVKNTTLYLYILSWHFYQKFCVFIIFIPFFDELSIEFPQQNINQSKTGIGGKKFSVELYV